MLLRRQRSGDDMIIIDQVCSPLNCIVNSDLHIIRDIIILKTSQRDNQQHALG